MVLEKAAPLSSGPNERLGQSDKRLESLIRAKRKRIVFCERQRYSKDKQKDKAKISK